MPGRRWAAVIAAVALFFGTAAVAIAQTSGPEPVTCSYDGSMLSCPLPQQTVTETASTTSTVTADPITVFTTATATTTVNPPTVTAPPSTVTVTRTTTRTVTASPSTTSSSAKPATSSQPTTAPAPTTQASPTSTTPTAGLNCAPRPSACGYPDATNTGAQGALRKVPGDVSSGPGWHYDSRGWVEVDGDGAVLDSLDIPVNLDITASNVTVKNTRVTEHGESFGISLRHTANVTIQDVTLAPTPTTDRLLVSIKDIYGDSTGLKILRANISGSSTGVQIDAGLLQDSYIHDLLLKSGDHINGTTSNGGGTLLTIRHNTVLNSYSQTDAVSLFEDFGGQANKVIDGNLLAGGGYTIYGGANPGGQPTSNIKITNNRISRLYYPNGGSYGWLTATDSGATVTGNIWDDTAKLIN